MYKLITGVTSLSTLAKNTYDLAINARNTREQTKLINAERHQQTRIFIQQDIEATRQEGLHCLVKNSQNYLIDSYERIRGYEGTKFGDMLYDTTVRVEGFSHRGYIDEFNNRTRSGGLK